MNTTTRLSCLFLGMLALARAHAGDTVRIQSLGVPLLDHGLCYSAADNAFFVIGPPESMDQFDWFYKAFQITTSGDPGQLADWHIGGFDGWSGNHLHWFNGSFYLTTSPASIWVSQTTAQWTSLGHWSSSELYDLAYGGEIYSAVGRGFANSLMVRSFNGLDWSTTNGVIQGNPTGCYLNAVAYGAYGGGIFAAVGTKGTILLSDDAARWTTRGLSRPFTDSLNGVCYGNGYFVAVGDYGQTITGAGSPDWEVATNVATFNKLNAVCYGDGKFVAVGDSGTWLTSTNGQAWSRVEILVQGVRFLEDITDVAYGNHAFVGITPAGSILVVTTNVAPREPVTILSQPISQTAFRGASAEFSVDAQGSYPLTYQWLRNGAALAEGGRLQGVKGEVLRITSAELTDAGDYRVVVSNSVGAVTSAVAVLTVTIPPGQLLWSYQFGTGEIWGSPAIGQQGTLYVTVRGKAFRDTAYCGLHAFDERTGTKKWSFLTGNHVYSSPAVGPGGMVYFGCCINNKVYAVDGATGAKKWDFVTGNNVYSSPAIGPDGTVYVTSVDGKLYALNGTNGAKKWEFPGGGSVAVSHDGTVYLGSKDRLVALDGVGGVLKWAFQMPPSSSSVGTFPVIGSDGTVYCTGPKVYALDHLSGAKKWEALEGADTQTACPTIGIEGTIYVGGAATFYALDGRTGAQKWTFDFGGVFWDREARSAVGADGTVYVCNWQSTKLCALDGSTGATNWEFVAGSDIQTSPTIGPDGTVYLGSYGGTLYAIYGGTPPADSAWPMLGHDAQHTGRAAPLGPGPVSLSLVGGQATLRWSGDFMLQTAIDVRGPWADLTGALSGYQVNPVGQRRFFRLRSK